MKIIICWIDDDKDHELDAKNLEMKMIRSSNKGKVLFYHPRRFKNIIESKKRIDLFLMDYQLNTIADSKGKKYEGKGISYIGLLRENYPDIPIYAFSALPKLGASANQTYVLEKETEYRLDYSEIQDRGHELLYHDALDYKTIRKATRKGINELIKLLKPPEIEKERIMGLLPHILKICEFKGIKTENIAGKSLDFASWVRKILLPKPGFLYNQIHSATAIGMTETAFLDRKDTFASALYTGVFSASLTEGLWWKAKLYEVVTRKAIEQSSASEMSSDIRKIGVTAFNLKDTEIARCVFCGAQFPDTVGIDEDDLEKPVHFRCSEVSPEDTKTLFFDDRRVIKPKGAKK